MSLVRDVLIVGGSSGIGAAAAKLFLQKGDRILLIGKTASHVNKVVHQLRGISPHVTGMTLDVVDENKVEQSITQILEWGSPQIVLLSMGEGAFGPIETITSDSYRKVFDSEVKGKLFLLKHLSRTLIKNEATILVIGSTLSFEAIPEATLYVAAKHAVLGLIKALQEEWFHTRVRVIGVHPGDVDTPFFPGGPPHPSRVIHPKDLAELLYCLTILPESLTVSTIIVQPRVRL